MATGKSLELAQIQIKGARVLCICGAVWNDHLTKKGELRKKFDPEKHTPTSATTSNRARRRKLGLRGGFAQSSLSQRRKAK